MRYNSYVHFLKKIDLLIQSLQMVKNLQNNILSHQYTCGNDSATPGRHPGTSQLKCLSRTLLCELRHSPPTLSVFSSALSSVVITNKKKSHKAKTEL